MPVTYAYPNGTLFEVERDTLIAAGIMLDADSPTQGRQWNRGADEHHQFVLPAAVGSGQEVILADIGAFQRPERPEGYRLLDSERLISILNAFRGGIALPVLTADRGWQPSMNGRSGRGFIVRNGFHRFHASIIYGYSKLPILVDKLPQAVAVPTTSGAKKYVPPHLR